MWLRAKVGAVHSAAGRRREGDVASIGFSRDPNGVVQAPLEAGSGQVRGEVGSQVDAEVGDEVIVQLGRLCAGGSPIRGLVVVPESGGEVSFPIEFSGVVEKPLAAPAGGGFDLGDAVDGSFGVVESLPASLELVSEARATPGKPVEVVSLSEEVVLNFRDGEAVGALEPSPPVQTFECGLGRSGDGFEVADPAVEAVECPLFGGGGAGQGRELVLEPAEAAQLGA